MLTLLTLLSLQTENTRYGSRSTE